LAVQISEIIKSSFLIIRFDSRFKFFEEKLEPRIKFFRNDSARYLVQRIRGVNGLIMKYFEGTALLIKEIGLLDLMA